MNENLYLGADGFRLLMDWEKGPSDGSVPVSMNGAALAPYVCPGGELTIGWGCTHWFDGSEVQIHHRLASEGEAVELLHLQVRDYEDAVRAVCEREPTQHQFDAMTCLAFNIGIANFKASSALKSFNLGRFEDAAVNFGKWTGATCDRPPATLRQKYASKIGQDHKGLWRWIGEDGQYCRYMLRYVGLLNRHYSEALLFMGKDWRRAIRDGGIKLTLTPTEPEEAKWNASKRRWEDDVREQTHFKDVLAFAYDDKLSEIEPDELILFDKVEAAAPIATEAKEAAPVSPQPTPEPASLQIPSAPSVESGPSGAGKAGEPEHAAPTASTAPPLTPSSAPVSLPAGSGSAAEAKPAAPRPLPLPLPPPKLPPVIAPKQIDPRTIPYGEVGPDCAPKNMTDSRRVIGMVIVGAGSLVQILAGREIVSSTMGAVFFDMSRDPVLVALMAGGVAMFFGWVIRKRGTHIVAKGMIEAKQVLK